VAEAALHIIGSVALDSISGPGGKAENVLGGSALYASYAASFFSGVKLIACVGKDFPPAARKVIDERRIDSSGLETLDGPTFRWSGRYEEAFRTRHTLSLDLGVFRNFRPALGGPLPKGTTLFLGNIDPDIQLEVLSQAGGAAFVAADTIDHWIKLKRKALLEGLRRTHLFFLNNEEAELLTGENNLIKAARKIREMGPEMVVIKKGEHGALLYTDRIVAVMPAFPLERVADPTGAGDVFAGAMLGYLAREGRDDETKLKGAMARAAVMSSFVVEEFSVDRLRRLTSGDIDERLAAYRRLTAF